MHAGERYSPSRHFLIGTADYRYACILPPAHCLNPHPGPGALNGLGWHRSTRVGRVGEEHQAGAWAFSGNGQTWMEPLIFLPHTVPLTPLCCHSVLPLDLILPSPHIMVLNQHC